MNSSRARLAKATKNLTVKWAHTKESWKDEKSLEFEREYIGNLLTAVRTAGAAIDNINLLLAKVRSDCE